MRSKKELRKCIGMVIENERHQAKCTLSFIRFLKTLIESLNDNKHDTVKVDKIVRLIRPELQKLEKNIKMQQVRLLELISELG